jgi:hypothetical protein
LATTIFYLNSILVSYLIYEERDMSLHNL